MKRAMWKYLVWSVLLGWTMAGGLHAQFHSKSQTGQTAVNQQAVQSAQQQAASMSGRAVAGLGGGIGGGDMILPEAQRQALSQYGVRLGEMTGKQVDIWGRAIHHSDETYTESKQDMLTNTLKQVTKSKNGTRLQTRMISLDQMGRPSEVMIYDGRGQFKYRGVQLYDTLGRFSEEQIYDAKGTLIRRKVQEYTARGEKLPVRSWNYVANVPEDLKLVITRESEEPESAAPVAKTRSGLFGGAAKQAPSPQATSPRETADAAPAPGRRGLNLGRFFSGKKSE
ncbi:MAG: hypothetical protein GXX91_11775 [Verrucomicrobiaceae bacterium]|nr:hypothetical protein [Verrucomicrobiaceae bacterium]